MRAIGSGNEDEGAYLNVRRSNLQDKAGVREWEGFRVRVRVEFGIEVKVGVGDITGTEVCGMIKPNHNIGVGHAIDIGVAVGDRISVEVGIDVKVGVGDVIEIGVEVGV